MYIVRNIKTNWYICYDIDDKTLMWCADKNEALEFDTKDDATATVFFMKENIDDMEVIKI